MASPAFPHMAPLDIPLFATFLLSDLGRSFDRWEFDVSVGPGVDPGPAYDPRLRDNAIYLTQAKIDAVGYAGQIATIFEVKPQMQLSAFGQLLGYRWYYQQHTGHYAQLGGITDYMSPQYKVLYAAHDVDVYEVKPATPDQVYEAVEIVKAMFGGQIKPTRLVWTGTLP